MPTPNPELLAATDRRWYCARRRAAAAGRMLRKAKAGFIKAEARGLPGQINEAWAYRQRAESVNAEAEAELTAAWRAWEDARQYRLPEEE